MVVHGATSRGEDDSPPGAGGVTGVAGAVRHDAGTSAPPRGGARHPRLHEWQLHSDEATERVATFRNVRDHPDPDPSGHVALGALSVAIGLAVIAVGEVAVDFMLDISGYCDLPRGLDYRSTGHYVANTANYLRTANEYGKWMVARNYAKWLSAPGDREMPAIIVQRKLHDHGADVDDLAQTLSREGPRRVYLLFERHGCGSCRPASVSPTAVSSDIRTLDMARGVTWRACLPNGSSCMDMMTQ